MSSQKVKWNTKDLDIRGSLPALRRAAKNARALSIATGTPFYIWRNGTIVDLNAKKKGKNHV